MLLADTNHRSWRSSLGRLGIFLNTAVANLILKRKHREVGGGIGMGKTCKLKKNNNNNNKNYQIKKNKKIKKKKEASELPEILLNYSSSVSSFHATIVPTVATRRLFP